jgi:hypothetical protein
MLTDRHTETQTPGETVVSLPILKDIEETFSANFLPKRLSWRHHWIGHRFQSYANLYNVLLVRLKLRCLGKGQLLKKLLVKKLSIFMELSLPCSLILRQVKPRTPFLKDSFWYYPPQISKFCFSVLLLACWMSSLSHPPSFHHCNNICSGAQIVKFPIK